jgi:hypothetical protein
LSAQKGAPPLALSVDGLDQTCLCRVSLATLLRKGLLLKRCSSVRFAKLLFDGEEKRLSDLLLRQRQALAWR